MDFFRQFDFSITSGTLIPLPNLGELPITRFRLDSPSSRGLSIHRSDVRGFKGPSRAGECYICYAKSKRLIRCSGCDKLVCMTCYSKALLSHEYNHEQCMNCQQCYYYADIRGLKAFKTVFKRKREESEAAPSHKKKNSNIMATSHAFCCGNEVDLNTWTCSKCSNKFCPSCLEPESVPHFDGGGADSKKHAIHFFPGNCAKLVETVVCSIGAAAAKKEEPFFASCMEELFEHGKKGGGQSLFSRPKMVHQCHDSAVKTARVLRTSTKPCPKCRRLIERSYGCNHMFCTICHASFDWETGTILTRSTNPLFALYTQGAQANIQPTACELLPHFACEPIVPITQLFRAVETRVFAEEQTTQNGGGLSQHAAHVMPIFNNILVEILYTMFLQPLYPLLTQALSLLNVLYQLEKKTTIVTDLDYGIVHTTGEIWHFYRDYSHPQSERVIVSSLKHLLVVNAAAQHFHRKLEEAWKEFETAFHKQARQTIELVRKFLVIFDISEAHLRNHIRSSELQTFFSYCYLKDDYQLDSISTPLYTRNKRPLFLPDLNWDHSNYMLGSDVVARKTDQEFLYALNNLFFATSSTISRMS